MRRILVILVTLGITIVSTDGRLTCTVKEKRSGEERYCQFPFIIGWKRYDSCTDYKDPDGKKWCSTKTSNHTLSLSMCMWEVKDIGDIVQMIAWRRKWGHAVIMGCRVLNVSIRKFVMKCVR